jgi:hypothetical protein
MNLLGSLVEFFDIWHLREVIVVILSYVIIHCKNLSIMEMMKTIYVHLFIGVILTVVANTIFAIAGPVVLEGGLDN